MRKGANRILSTLIVLIMVLSILPAAVFATGETASVLEEWNITLGDDIGVKFRLSSADYTVTATVNGAAVTPTISGNVATVNVAAAQMTDPIVLTVKDGGEIVHTGEYSVREYAKTILDGKYDDYVKDMVKQMLNYGAAAQTYFNYKTNNLANAGYELDANADVPTVYPETIVTDNLEGIELYGTSLVLRNKTAVRFYFTLEEGSSIGDFTFSQGKLGMKHGMHFVEIDGINPQDLAEEIELNVDNGALSITYSPLSYIVKMYNNADNPENVKPLVQALYGYHEEAKYYDSVVPVGSLQSSVHGWSNGGIYATMPANDAYFVQDDWGIEYTPVNADVIKLVRGGETTSVGVPGNGALIKFTATDYYLKTQNQTISGDVLPLQDQDYLIVDGRFYHPATGNVMYISKTYIYNNGGTLEFSTTEPVLPVSCDVGVLQAHNAGAGGGGIYFTTQEVNDAPYGENGAWDTYYDSASVDCLKLVRGGETISVGLTGRNTICKFGANDYYLRLEEHTIGSYAPFTTDDMFIIEGAYTHASSKTTLNIAKTYIYYDGSNWVFSSNLPVTYDVGVLQANVNGHGAYNNGIYFSTQETNDAPYGDWNTYYDTANEDCLKLVRGGETISVGLTGKNTICKFSANDYALRLENWTIGDYAPFTTDDMFIVEGAYTHANSKTTLNIAKTYIYYDGSNWVFSDTEPVYEPETESPFTFDKGVFSADIFNNRNGGLSVSVENKQLKLQQPAGASNWLWLNKELKAGTVITMDVAFSGEGMNIFGYGSKANGDPITDGTVTESVPQSWFWGQGGDTSGSHTFTIYEDCYGLSLMLGFAGSTETAIYIDNVVITPPAVEETESPFTFDSGLFSADIFNNRNGGLSVSVENKQLKLQQPAGASNWLWIKQDMKAGTVITMDVTFSGEGMNIFGYGSKANGDPITDGTVTESVPQSWFWGQGGDTSGSYTFTIYEDCYGLSLMLGFAGSTETAIYIDNVVITAPEVVEPTVVSGGNMTEHGDGWDAAGDIFFALAENEIPVDENAETEYAAESGVIKLVRGNNVTELTGTVVKYGATDYYMVLSGDALPLQNKDYLIVEGNFVNAENNYILNVAKSYVLVDGENLVYSTTEPDLSTSYDVGVLQANVNGHGAYDNGIYFSTAETNDAPYGENGAWDTHYDSASVDCLKLVRGGETISVGLTGRNTICKFSANDYALRLENWTIGDYAPFTTDDMFIVEGAYTHANSKTTLNIAKTYIYYDGSNWVFSDTEPVYEPETESPFTFDKGVFSADIFNNRNNGLSVSVENKQLKLQQPAGASNWLWLKQDMKAGTVITMDVTFSGEGMNIYGYGSNQNGDPITSGAVTEPAAWYNGQGGNASGSYTFTIYEDCYGLSLMLGFAGSTETAIYIDNVVIKLPAETQSPFTFDGGSYSADIFNNRNNGPTVSVENKQLKLQQPAGASNWLWIKQDMKAGTVITMDVTFSGEGMNIYGYGSNQNGDPITSGAVTEPAAWYNGQGGNASGSYTFTIYEDCYGLSLMLGFAGSTETAIYIDNVVITAPAPSTAYDVGVLQANVNGHGAYNNGIYFSTQETNDAPYGDWNTYYDTANEDCLKLIRNGQIISVGLTGRNTICKFSANDYALRLENHTIGEYAPFTTDDIFIVEGAFTHVNSKTTLNIAKTYIYYDGSNWVFSATEPVFEPETESPFTFNKGVFSADIFNNRNNGLSVSVENKQLKLQQPAGASNWLWLRQNMKAGTVVTMDVTFSGEGMNIYGYGANGNGDPITEGTVTDSVPQSWFWGQGGNASGSYTFTIYEDCYGLALMLGFAGSTETAIYIDNVVIKLPAETQSPFTFDGGSYSADIFNNRNGGLSVSVENKQLKLQQPAGASNWLWIKQDMPAGTVITMDVTFSAEGMNIFGYGAKANGDPITEGTATESVPQGWFWGQGGSTNGSYTFTIYEDCYGLSLMLGFAGSTETAIYIDNVVITKPIETDFGTVILPTSTDTLNIGVWNGSEHAFVNERLKELQAAGITKITGVNTDLIGTDNVNAWLDRVYSYGIRVIIDLRGWDGATVPAYANHPGLIGFLMYDEPNTSKFDELAALKAKFDAVMPADKLFYVNLFPESAADSTLGELTWWEELTGTNLDYDTDYVTAFLNKLNIEVLSWDNYSLVEGSGIRTEYFHNFEVMASKNLPMWYTMLSAGHSAGSTTYKTPTADELRWQMAVAMTYGVHNIDHYIYTSHEDGYSCMFDHNTQNVTNLYYDIKDVDNEYLAWDHIYMAYTWQGVGAYDAGTSNAMLTMLENKLNLTNYGLTVTSSNEDLLVGVFDHNGNKAYMITNAGSAGTTKVGEGKNFETADATVTVKLAEGSYKCAAVIDNGKISWVAVNADNTVTLSVEAYEGVFIIPVLN